MIETTYLSYDLNTSFKLCFKLSMFTLCTGNVQDVEIT